MITVPELTEEIVRKSPFLEEGLARGIINLSSLARIIQPEIQEKLMKDIKPGAIMMALKRLSRKIKPANNQKLADVLKNISDITVRSNILEFAFENSSSLIDKQRKLLDAILEEKNTFFTTSAGVYETSLFVSQNLDVQVKKIFQDEKLRYEMNDLSAITLILPKEAVFVPGVYYSVLKTLAWEGINFIEVVSSYTELTIILQNSNVDRAFSVLKNLSLQNTHYFFMDF